MADIKEKKVRVSVDVTSPAGKDGVKFFRGVASTVDKESGTKRVITSTEASDFKRMMYWLKINVAAELKAKPESVQYNVKGKPKKADKQLEAAE